MLPPTFRSNKQQRTRSVTVRLFVLVSRDRTHTYKRLSATSENHAKYAHTKALPSTALSLSLRSFVILCVYTCIGSTRSAQRSARPDKHIRTVVRLVGLFIFSIGVRDLAAAGAVSRHLLSSSIVRIRGHIGDFFVFVFR